MSDYDPQRDGPPVYEPTVYVTDGQPQEWIDVEETLYPGLSAFLEQLHAEWAATDHGEPVEPVTYYPPQRQGMHQNVDSPSENET